MANILNIKKQQDKGKLKKLLISINNIDDDKINNSSLEDFETRRAVYKEKFIQEHNIKNDNIEILYNICSELKKKYRKNIDESFCMLSSIASNIIIELVSPSNKCVENELYKKVRRNWAKNTDKENYFVLKKNFKNWMNEIQTALKTEDYDLLTNSMSLMSFFASKSFEYKKDS